MSCEELRELYELYVLGALDPAERRELDEHLARNCPQCTPGVRQARGLVGQIALAAPAAEPPERLRRRVLAAVSPDPEPRASAGWGLTHAWATAALLMFIAVVWYANKERQTAADLAALNFRLEQARTTNTELTAQNRVLSDALALVNLPESRQLVFGTTDPAPPRGRIWVHPERGVLLLASRLPAARAGRIYEMWVIPKSGPPAPAGLFNSDARGEATHVFPQPVNFGAVAAIAVTEEPAAGVPAPTSTPLIVAKF
jgi:anti-sigma-K factor RskA